MTNNNQWKIALLVVLVRNLLTYILKDFKINS